MRIPTNYEFWRILDAPHFIQEDIELKEYDRRSLFSEYASFFGDLLQHLKGSGKQMEFAIFKNEGGKIRCGYSVPKDLQMSSLLQTLRYLNLHQDPETADEFSLWQGKIRRNISARVITKKIRYLLGGRLTELSDSIDGETIEQSVEETDVPILEHDTDLRQLVAKKQVVCFPTISPYRIDAPTRSAEVPALDTRWASLLSSLVSSEANSGFLMKIQPKAPGPNDLGFSLRCIQLYGGTYTGIADREQERRDLSLNRAISSLEPIFAVAVIASADLGRAFLQDTDPKIFDSRAAEEVDMREFSLVNCSGPLENAAEDTVEIVSKLPLTYTADECSALLLPPFSFRDALPGINSLIPKPFVVPNLAGDLEENESILFGYVGSGSKALLHSGELNRHVFISGGSGSGKSYFAQQILHQLPDEVHYLVIDPVKDSRSYVDFKASIAAENEKRKERSSMGFQRPPPKLIELGSGRPPAFNPFIIPEGGNIFTHSSIMARVMSLATPTTPTAYEYWLGMVRYTYKGKFLTICHGCQIDPRHAAEKYAEALYGDASSTYREVLSEQWIAALPTLSDVQGFGLGWLRQVLGKSGEAAQEHPPVPTPRSQHSIDAKELYERWWRSVHDTHPLFYAIMSSGSLDSEGNLQAWTRLFDRDTIITLGAVTDSQENSALTSLFLFLLNEHALSTRKTKSVRLAHVTLIEEAHRVMPANARGYGKDVMSSPEEEAGRQLSQMLAELREYGEGIIIAEQSPSKLLPDAMINTATKVVKRTTYGPDIDALANSIGLSVRERAYLPRLTKHEALAMLADNPQPLYLSDFHVSH